MMSWLPSNVLQPFTRRRFGAVLAIGGLAFAIVSRYPGLLLGETGEGVGWMQMIGIGAGAFVVFLGVVVVVDPYPDQVTPVQIIGISLWEHMPRRVASPQAVSVLVGLLLLAAWLRFHALDFQSLWLDEIITWWRAGQPTLPAAIRDIRNDVWPPGYPLLLFYLIRWVGSSEFLLRFPSALAGVVGVAALYALGRRSESESAGLVAAALGTVLHAPVYYSQEARPYAFLICFATLSTFLWWGILLQLRQGRLVSLNKAIGYVLTAVTCLYLHYFGLLLIGLQAIGCAAALVLRPRRLVTAAWLYSLISLMYVPWITPTLEDLGREAAPWIPPPGSYWHEGLRFLRSLLNESDAVVAVAVAASLAGLAASLIASRRHPGVTVQGKPFSRKHSLWLAILWLAMPFSITYARSLFSTPLVYTRYLTISFPALCLLIGIMMARLPVKQLVRSGLAAGLTVLLLAHLVWAMHYYEVPNKEQYREAVDYLLANEAHPDRALVVGFLGFGTAWPFDYYFAQRDSPIRIEAHVTGEDAARDIATVRSAIEAKRPSTVWVLSITRYNQHHLPVIRYLEKTYPVKAYVAYFGSEVWAFNTMP